MSSLLIGIFIGAILFDCKTKKRSGWGCKELKVNLNSDYEPPTPGRNSSKQRKNSEE